MSLSIENNHVKGIHVADASGKALSLPCDVLVIAAGPWTGSLSKRLGLPTPIPVFSYAGHSLLVRPSAPVTKECLFMTLATPTSSYHPEIFPRRSGEVYIGGINEDLGLPEDPVAATPQKSEIRKLVEIADTLFAEYTIEKEQLCFRPMTEHGDPFVCPVPEVEGVFVGAGHSFWGLTLGPGTGKVLSEMVLGEELSADVSPMLSLDEVEE